MSNMWCIFVIAAVANLVVADWRDLPHTCDSEIYCYGPLLDTVQMAGLYKDSKTFVDMKIKFSPNITMDHFHEMMDRTSSRPTKADIQEFVNQNFDPEGSEFEDWRPTDWKDNPAFLSRIKDPLFHQWASDLNRLWLDLGRKMKNEVRDNPDLYSIIYVNNPVIVPGGRFREFYYWDSYWIIKGLLLSEMRSTAKGMVSNFLSVVERIGFIPNGGRIYYKMRSQPPLLIPMVDAIMQDHDDVEFLRAHIHTLDKEFDYWMTNHSIEVDIDGHKYQMTRYNDMSQGPRPESYREDVLCARHFDTQEKREALYGELKAAAESGWDFSSRWFILNGTNTGNLTNLQTRSIIPVDLNAIMCWNARLLTDYHTRLGHVEKAAYYSGVHARYMEAIEKVLWHEDVGAWLDLDVQSGHRRDYFHSSNFAPLWAEAYDKGRKEYFVSRIINYLDRWNVDKYLGGVPTTYQMSGEQWDFPYAWAPLQYIIVRGLEQTNMSEATRVAREFATKWVRSNFEVWRKEMVMYEKYDVSRFGGAGGGGEYIVQTGFGWTNGVIMELLNSYGETISVADAFDSAPAPGAVRGASVGASGVATAVLVVIASVVAGALGLMVYRKRKEFPSFNPAEGVRLMSKKPYTELKSFNGAAHARQR